MNIHKSLTNQQYNRYSIGLKGQDFIEGSFIKAGYVLYKKNFKKIGLEIDLVVFKHIKASYKNNIRDDLLIIHIVEVKTRSEKYSSIDLEEFGLPNKWRKVRGIMFDFVYEIKEYLHIDCNYTITFDLAIVTIDLSASMCNEGKDICKLKKYIKNIDLLL